LYIGFEIEFKEFATIINKSTINILKPLIQKTIFISFVGEKYDDFNILLNYLSGEENNIDNNENNFEGKQNIDNYFIRKKGITYIVRL